MTGAQATSLPWLKIDSLPRFILSFGVGIGVSLSLFLGLAAVQHQRVEPPPPPVEDLRAVALPVQPPPPVPQEEQLQVPDSDFIQLEASASPESDVKLPAAPITADTVPLVNAVPKFDISPTVNRPSLNVEERDMRHIFSRSDVQQRAVAIFRKEPEVTDRQVDAMKSLRALFLMVAEPDGSVSNIQLVSSCGSTDVDQACIAALSEWKFKPAVRRGKAVRCWVQQSLLFKIAGRSVFEAH